jgi:hypothetical protein
MLSLGGCPERPLAGGRSASMDWCGGQTWSTMLRGWPSEHARGSWTRAYFLWRPYGETGHLV